MIRIGDFARPYKSDFQSQGVQEYIGDYPKRFELRPGTLLLAMTCQTRGGEILGVPMRVPDDGRLYLHNQRIGRVEVEDPDVLDHKFLEFLLQSHAFNRHLFASASGSAILHTSPDRIGTFEVPLPPIEEQRRIAAVLGAIDDLIDTNRRLIDQHVSIADEAAAALSTPEAGMVSTFGEIADVFGGGTPRTSEAEYWGGQIPWATPSDLTALPSPYLFETARSITDVGLANCSSSLYPPGSILMTSRATIGAFALAQRPVAVNQGFIVVVPRREVDRLFLFHEMRRRVTEFIQRANGSTFLELSRGVFKKLSVSMPSDRDLEQLSATLDPIHASAALLQSEITELEATRDQLLPLLLSGAVSPGEVDVGAA